MALNADFGQVDSNSYVTEAEADTYFAERLGSDLWDSASSANKEAALIMATRDIDKNRFLGQKWRVDQSLKWPRIFRRDSVATYRTGRRSLEMWFDTITDTVDSTADLSNFVFNSLIESGELPGNRPANYWVGGQAEIISGSGVGEIQRVTASSRITGNITVIAPFTALDTTSKIILSFKIPRQLLEATCEQAINRLGIQDNKRSKLINQGVKRIKVGNTEEEYTGNAPATLSTEAQERLKTLTTRLGWIT